MSFTSPNVQNKANMVSGLTALDMLVRNVALVPENGVKSPSVFYSLAARKYCQKVTESKPESRV